MYSWPQVLISLRAFPTVFFRNSVVLWKIILVFAT